jgi:hypothetical protein
LNFLKHLCKMRRILIMFKKSLAGLFSIATVAGSLVAIAPANATQSSTGIQETAKAEKTATKDTSDSAKAAEAAAKTKYDNSVTAETAAKTKYDDSVAAEKTALTTYNNSVNAEKTAKATYDKSVTAEATALTTYNKSVTAEAAALTTYNKSVTAEATALANYQKNNTSKNKASYEKAQNTTKANLTSYETAQNTTKTNLTSYQTAQNTAKTNLTSYETAQNTTKTNLTSHETAKTAIATNLSLFQTAKGTKAYDLSLYQAAQAGSKAWGNWTTTHTVQDKSTDIPEFTALIPQFQALVQKEGKEIPGDQVAAKRLDPSKLFLINDHNVRVRFLNEGAGYRNQLAYESTKGSSYNKGMIFSDVSCTSGCQMGNGMDGVLDIGDYVDLGVQKGGSLLNFLIKADGANVNPANGDIYSGNASLNSDKLQHLMAWEVGDYLMMGFEDLRNGGDKDYNDVMFVVDFGKGNLTSKVPEPGTMAALLGVTGAAGWLRRRKNQASA